jgi:hypothetical protein
MLHFVRVFSIYFLIFNSENILSFELSFIVTILYVSKVVYIFVNVF